MTGATRQLCSNRLCFVPLLLGGVAGLSQAFGQEKSALPEHYVLDRIRVFYTTDGISAVQPGDTDSNGVPDHVEDVAKQVWAARRLFCEVLGFPDPLTSARYAGVTCIEICIRDRAELGGRNGAAYDESQRARRIPEGKPDDRAIVMALGRHVVAAKNLSPAHELFHLIQYGATYFKNGWFLEGQTRWSEHALGQGGLGDVEYLPRGPWPQPSANLPALFATNGLKTTRNQRGMTAISIKPSWTFFTAVRRRSVGFRSRSRPRLLPQTKPRRRNQTSRDEKVRQPWRRQVLRRKVRRMHMQLQQAGEPGRPAMGNTRSRRDS